MVREPVLISTVTAMPGDRLTMRSSICIAVRSSDTLVQYTKAIWGDAGRTAHFISVHHIIELRKEALAWFHATLARELPYCPIRYSF